MKKLIIIIVLLLTNLFGCNDNMSVTSPPLGKYKKSECVVDIEFFWDDDQYHDDIANVMTKYLPMNSFPIEGNTYKQSVHLIDEVMNRKVIAYQLYFFDKCENRIAMTEDILKKYLIPHIKDFPRYEVKNGLVVNCDADNNIPCSDSDLNSTFSGGNLWKPETDQ